MSRAEKASPANIADQHDLIRVHGARVNNLKDVSIELPKRRLTVFTGVSGSGKSSLVFGTIAAESQRLINETYSAFVQGFMPTLARPDVDVLDGLTTAIIVDQERMGADPRSTVGTATDANAMLRILFSRLGKPHIGSPQAFSFNVASISGAGAVTLERAGRTTKERRSFSILGGMCPRCEGRGAVNDIDLTQLYDDTKSLNEGALTIPGYSMDGWYGRIFGGCGFFDPDKPIKKFTKTRAQRPALQGADEDQGRRHQPDLRGADPEDPEVDAVQGRRLAAAAHPGLRRAGGHLHHLPRVRRHPAQQGGALVEDQRDATSPTPARCRSATWPPGCASSTSRRSRRCSQSLRHTLDSFVEIGLGYLSLDRPSGTLSGGEAQRTKMIRHLGSSLTDVTYVFDEPTIGLHPHDIERMNELLLQLRDKGNTVLVVEHKPEAIAIADHVVDLGPKAGSDGGEVVFEGTVERLAGERHDHRPAPRRPGRAQGDGADAGRERWRCAAPTPTTCKDVDVDIPLGVLVVVTGVAGSGKSSLIRGSVSGRDGVVSVDQGAIRGSRRSNPATYTGLLDPIRKAFAKENGVKPALFSANSEGACPNCNGAGVIYTDLGDDGRRRGHLRGVRGEAVRRRRCSSTSSAARTSARCSPCRSPRPRRSSATAPARSRRRTRSSSGSPTSGSATSPSASRSPRSPAASGSGSSWPPTSARRAASTSSTSRPTGLHLADVEQLLGLLDRLVDSGKSVIVIEHHQAVMAHADWIIDLGPGAGHDGGRIVFEGTPADLVADRSTLTGEHLAAYVGTRGRRRGQRALAG